MGTFKAIRIDKAEKGTTVTLTQFDEAELMDGDVTVAVEWSTLNYKDGLAVTGRAPVVRRFPMIAGIDFAGTVEQSSHPAWKAGDKVVCNGWGMGETHLGAYAEKARVKGDWLVRLPDGMSTREAMAIGTAGYTAMLSVLALEKQGLTPASGPVVVTGAAGGVGSVATAVLSKLGYHVIASTGRMSEADYLKGLGAPHDVKYGARWLGLAAQKGQHEAQAMLGKMLFSGDQLPRQAARGLMWLTLARDAAQPDETWITDSYNKAITKASEDDRAMALQMLEHWVQGRRD